MDKSHRRFLEKMGIGGAFREEENTSAFLKAAESATAHEQNGTTRSKLPRSKQFRAWPHVKRFRDEFRYQLNVLALAINVVATIALAFSFSAVPSEVSYGTGPQFRRSLGVVNVETICASGNIAFELPGPNLDITNAGRPCPNWAKPAAEVISDRPWLIIPCLLAIAISNLLLIVLVERRPEVAH